MKLFFSFLLLLCCTLTAHAQLEQGTWLVGGSGSFMSYKSQYTNLNTTQSTDNLNIIISSDIGYFIKSKVVIGLKPEFTKYKNVAYAPGSGQSNDNRIMLGPFIRYYLLNAEKSYNILTEISYQYGLYWSTPVKGENQTFSALIGPSLFLNSSVALEFLFGYYQQKEIIHFQSDNIYNKRGYQFSLGFQIHLFK
ncbi:hypothetical protein [Hydrotalea lipotrueae]|uniref:hypothetical protein n=1 Tax=Hydrotalea lipotrueae TaxID=2803817 RepID=UPI001C4416BD|nr:hypothetical protein [Hydrotalea lipotrueae]